MQLKGCSHPMRCVAAPSGTASDVNDPSRQAIAFLIITGPPTHSVGTD